MNKKILFLLLTLILAMAAAAPAAAHPREPVGDRINVFEGTPNTFPAGEPFHISHGWFGSPSTYEPPPANPPGRRDFQLFIDGVFRNEDFVLWSVDHDNPLGFMGTQWLHNFPEGMTGTHTFTGRWFLACGAAVDAGYYPGPCVLPNAKVLCLELSLEVTFE